MADNEIVYEIKADSKKAQAAIKDIDDSAKASAGSSVGIGKINSSLDAVNLAIKAVAAAYVTYWVGDALKNGIAAAIEQEDAINRMNNALAIAGRLSAESSADMITFSEKIQRTTTVADDAALSYLALATIYAKNNEQAKQLTMTAINMAAQMGGSVDGAVRQLGATFSGTTGRLSKLIPELGNLSEAQLKAGGAIDMLSKKFDGAGVNATKTFSGALKQLENKVGDVKEEVGFFFTKSDALRRVFIELGNQSSILAVQLGVLRTQNSDIFKPMLDTALNFAAGFTVVVGGAIEFVIGLFQRLGSFAGYVGAGLAEVFTGNFKGAFELLSDENIADALDFETAFKYKGVEAGLATIAGFKETVSMASDTITEGLPENLAPKIKLPVEEFETDVGIVSMLFGNLGERFKMNKAQIADFAKSTKDQMKGTFVQGVGNAMNAVGQALVNGGNALTAFGKAMLGMFGQLAQQLGMFYFVLGLATIYNDPGRGAGMIAGGLALMVVGGVLQALSGGGGGGSSAPSSGGGGGGGAAQSAGIVPEVGDQTTSLAETPERQRVSTVTVNIEGNVLGDKRTLGLEIADALNEAFGNDGILIARGAIS